MDTKLNEKRERLITYVMACSGDTREEAIIYIDGERVEKLKKKKEALESLNCTELNRFFI